LRAPSETFESKAFARWLQRQMQAGVLLFSKIPIGDSTLSGEEGKKLYHMGVRRGVPDFVIVHIATRKVLWVEMKREQGGVLSAYQKAWKSALGPSAAVAYGFKDAKAITVEWLYARGFETRDRRSGA